MVADPIEVALLVAGVLDRDYLRRSARILVVSDLLERVFKQVEGLG